MRMEKSGGRTGRREKKNKKSGRKRLGTGIVQTGVYNGSASLLLVGFLKTGKMDLSSFFFFVTLILSF